MIIHFYLNYILFMMPIFILLITTFHVYCSNLLQHSFNINDALTIVTTRLRASNDTNSNTRCVV